MACIGLLLFIAFPVHRDVTGILSLSHKIKLEVLRNEMTCSKKTKSHNYDFMKLDLELMASFT